MAILNKTGITDGGTIQSEHITRAIDALTGVSTDTIIATGSFTGSLNGSLIGTASFATTASYALNAAGGSSFPFVGVAVITGSLIVSGSANDVTAYTRNTTISASNTTSIAASNINLTGKTQIIGQAEETNWQATKYSILDWRTAGESGFDGQINLPLQAPGTPRVGAVYFDPGTKSLFVYNGSDWSEFQPIP
jgi:hypothetical protein